MSAVWEKQLGAGVSSLLSKARRTSTVKQQQVAGKKFKDWLRMMPGKPINKQSLLEFMIYLHESGLKSRTIKNYIASLAKPLLMGFCMDLKSQEFKDTIDVFFYQAPLPPG